MLSLLDLSKVNQWYVEIPRTSKIETKIAQSCHCYGSIINGIGIGERLCHLCQIHVGTSARKIAFFRLNIEFNFQNRVT